MLRVVVSSTPVNARKYGKIASEENVDAFNQSTVVSTKHKSANGVEALDLVHFAKIWMSQYGSETQPLMMLLVHY